MKRRLIAAAVTLLLFSCFAVFAAYNIDQLLSHQFSFSLRMPVCLLAVIRVPVVRLWFLLLEGSAGLTVSWMVFGREYIKYRSGTVHVCPGIDTPEAEGQGQYGTAHWLRREKDKEQAFTVVHVDSSAAIQELKARGQDDLEGYL